MKFYDIGKKLVDDFKRESQSAGFCEVKPVLLTSEIDATTLFVGSAISVFKPSIPPILKDFETSFIIQPCLRTRNMKFLNRLELPQWGSYFIALGLFGAPGQLATVHKFIIDFLLEKVELNPSRLVIRVNSSDVDLLDILEADRNKFHIEVDQFPLPYYRHSYGMEGYTGRNFNLGIRQTDGQILDIGNIILISHLGVPVAVDLGMGVNTLLCRVHNIYHPIMCSPIADLMVLKADVSIKLADSVTTAFHLLKEGLLPSASSRGKILRIYLQAISHLATKSGLTLQEVFNVIRNYEMMVDGRESDIPAQIFEYLQAFRRFTEKGKQEINKSLYYFFR